MAISELYFSSLPPQSKPLSFGNYLKADSRPRLLQEIINKCLREQFEKQEQSTAVVVGSCPCPLSHAVKQGSHGLV